MTRRLPTIEQFRALAAFAEAGGVRAAARHTDSHQPSITQKLNAFRRGERNNAILLTENGRILELTDAGRAVLPAIRDLLAQYDQRIECLSGHSDAAQRVRIAAGHFSSQFYLPQVFDKTLSESVQAEIRVVRGGDRILGVADGRYDIGVISHETSDIAKILNHDGRSTHSLKITPLQFPLMVVIAGKKSQEGEDLQSLPIQKSVTTSWLNRWELLGLDQESGIRRSLERKVGAGERVSFLTEGGGWSAAREFCRKGLGVAILPFATLSNADYKDFVIRRLSDKLAVQESVIVRTHPIGTGLQLILDRLKTVAANHQREIQRRWERFLSDRS